MNASVTAKQVETANRLNNNLALLQAGSNVSIDIVTPAGQRAKFRTPLIGYLPKKYVLIQLPDSTKLGSFANFINQGASITVRGLIEGHEGSVVAFVGKVKQTLQIPSRIIVLDFPKTVTLQSLRSSLRIHTDIDVKLKVGKEYWKGVIRNLSVHGCKVMVSNGESLTLVENKGIEVIVEDFEGMSNINLSALVCNIKSQLDGISLGIKFEDRSRSSVIKLVQHAVVAEI